MHKPTRTCSVCRRKVEKSELIRIVRVDGKYVIDEAQVAQGRGAYVCKSCECISKCVKKKALNRSFKAEIGESIYEDIAKLATKG